MDIGKRCRRALAEIPNRRRFHGRHQRERTNPPWQHDQRHQLKQTIIHSKVRLRAINKLPKTPTKIIFARILLSLPPSLPKNHLQARLTKTVHLRETVIRYLALQETGRTEIL